MAEYIDKNDLREYISGYIKSCNGKPTYTDMDAMVGIISLLEQMPAADVQPIVYAHKTINVGRRSYCSNCGKLAIMEDFCSKCGAKVKDGDAE